MSEIDRFCIAQHGVPIDHCLSVRTYALPDCHRIGGAEGERSSCGSSTHIWRQQADDLETVPGWPASSAAALGRLEPPRRVVLAALGRSGRPSIAWGGPVVRAARRARPNSLTG